MLTHPLVRATGLVRRFGLIRALDQLSLEVRVGELVLLLGANGAGKTTLLRALAGLVRPLRGRVQVCGRDVHAEPGARGAVGFLSHHAMVYDDLTPRENLRFHAALHRLDGAEREIEAALELVGLIDRADLPARGFSRGMLQRLALARTDLHRPPLLLLDEPFTGLDPVAADTLRQRIATWRTADRGIIAVTHDPAAIWTLATRVVVMQHGRIVHDQPRSGDLMDVRPTLDRWFVA
ncbi:MAG TPA: heme ABC exporter ATP-binding protein CcmA [Gemmatimonadales bacterium]|nr:heme ABC exporter ATP-binding protein CcmA [Gemmatimonadales bacterium]